MRLIALCGDCSQEAMLHQKEQEFAAANEAMLAGFLERINHIADVVGQDRHADHADCAGKLRTAVEDLKTVSCKTAYSIYSSAGRSTCQLKICAVNASLIWQAVHDFGAPKTVSWRKMALDRIISRQLIASICTSQVAEAQQNA